MEKRKFVDSCGSKQQKPHQPFIRNFEHVDGNWPSHIYLTGKYFRLKRISNLCLNHVLEHCDFECFTESKPHMSVSKPFVLRHHQIDSFIEQLGHVVKSLERFAMQVFSEYQILLNDSSTRLFISVPVEDRDRKVRQIVGLVDSILEKYLQPLYYKDPIFHISLASSPVTLPSKFKANFAGPVVHVSEKQRVRRRFSLFETRGQQSHGASACDSDSNDSDSDGSDDDSGIISSVISSDTSSGINSGMGGEGSEGTWTAPQTEFSEVIIENSLPADNKHDTHCSAEDCLGSVLEITGIECRIGNRTFRCEFNEKCLGFKELK